MQGPFGGKVNVESASPVHGTIVLAVGGIVGALLPIPGMFFLTERLELSRASVIGIIFAVTLLFATAVILLMYLAFVLWHDCADKASERGGVFHVYRR